jgi:hypothetical protein
MRPRHGTVQNDRRGLWRAALWRGNVWPGNQTSPKQTRRRNALCAKHTRLCPARPGARNIDASPPTKKSVLGDWACSPMVGRSSGTLPTRVQILVLAPFPGFSWIYWRYALSGKRRSRRRRDAIGDFENLQIYRCSVGFKKKTYRWIQFRGHASWYIHLPSLCSCAIDLPHNH